MTAKDPTARLLRTAISTANMAANNAVAAQAYANRVDIAGIAYRRKLCRKARLRYNKARNLLSRAQKQWIIWPRRYNPQAKRARDAITNAGALLAKAPYH